MMEVISEECGEEKCMDKLVYDDEETVVRDDPEEAELIEIWRDRAEKAVRGGLFLLSNI